VNNSNKPETIWIKFGTQNNTNISNGNTLHLKISERLAEGCQNGCRKNVWFFVTNTTHRISDLPADNWPQIWWKHVDGCYDKNFG